MRHTFLVGSDNWVLVGGIFMLLMDDWELTSGYYSIDCVHVKCKYAVMCGWSIERLYVQESSIVWESGC